MAETKEYSTHRGGRTSRRRLGFVMGIASTLLIISAISFFSVGMVGAALGVGIGGFAANFDSVNSSSGGEIYPILGEQPACQNAPQLRASLNGTTKLNGGVEFYKDLPLPDDFSNNEFARISIVASAGANPIEVKDLGISLTALEADNLSLGDAAIREFANNSYETGYSGYGVSGAYLEPGDGRGGTAVNDPSTDAMDPNSGTTTTPEFGIDAPGGFEIENGTAAAHLVNFGSINLNDLDLFVQILNESNATANGPAYRVINPTERTCDALASNSKVDNATDLTTADGGTDFATP